MPSHIISSFIDFMKYSDSLDLVANHMIFRGQPTQGRSLDIALVGLVGLAPSLRPARMPVRLC